MEMKTLKIWPIDNGWKWKFACLAFPSWTEMEFCRFFMKGMDGNGKIDTSSMKNFKQPYFFI